MNKRILLASFLLLFVVVFTVGCNSISAFKQSESVIEPALLMFSGSNENINSGELYIQEIGGEKEKLANTALKDEYLMAPNSHAVLLLNDENELYLKIPGEEKTKISGDVLPSSYCFSNDESTIAFLVKSGTDDNPSSDLYISKIGDEKEKISTDFSVDATKSNYKLSNDAGSIIFINADSVLYKWSAADGKEKIAGDVDSFNAYDNNNAYSYVNNEGIYYVKFSNDTEAQRISVDDVNNLRVSGNGLMAVFTGGFNQEKGYGELYTAAKGSDVVKISSNVKNFSISGNNLFYINDENCLYSKKLPDINSNMDKHSAKFADKVNSGKKKKLGSEVLYHEISPNGKNVAFIDNDSNLYLCYDETDKVKVASDVATVRVFDTRLVFANRDHQLYLNSVISETGNMKENNKMIAQLLNDFNVIDNGKRIIFTTSDSDALTMLVDGVTTQVLIDECNTYDIILIQNKKSFEKKLLLSDIVGIYKNADIGVAYKITNDKQFVLYEKGEEKETADLKFNGINRLSAVLKSDDRSSFLSQNDVMFLVTEDGTRMITISGTSYTLEAIDEEGLSEELERQKKAEADAKAAAEQKAAAEKAAAELKARKERAEISARNYYSNGVQISSYETLYYSPDYGSASSTTFRNNHLGTVYDYQISSDGWTIWLEVKSSEGNYWWVAR